MLFHSTQEKHIVRGQEHTHFSPLIACALAVAAEPSNFNLADDLLFVDWYNLSPVRARAAAARSKSVRPVIIKKAAAYGENCRCSMMHVVPRPHPQK